ncbi:hypothetical protein Tco_0186350 [Tanacetum coccineum]
MINATSSTPSDASSRVEETNDVHNKNNFYNQEKGRSHKKPRKLKFDINLPSTHFCKSVKQILEGQLKFWLKCDPNIKECNGGHEIYEMNKEGDLKKWYCYYDDDRKRINRANLSFLEFMLVKYGENQEKGLIWDERFEEWCINNPNTPTSRTHRQIDQLADEYELGIGKKGHMLDDIWENCRKVQGDNTYWWHDQKSEEEERRKLGINIEEYDPPMVHVETFKVKRYSFDTGQSFICVTKELKYAFTMGRENESRLRDMICKEVNSGRRIHRQT